MVVGSRRMRIAVALLVAVAALAAGGLQLLPFFDRKATLEAAETTEGTITSAEYNRNQYAISYEYTVDGQTYETDRVFPEPYSPDGIAGQNAREQLPVYEDQQTVTVNYDPANPSYAWLVTRDAVVSRHVLYFLVTGFVALVCVTYCYAEVKLAGAGDDSGGGPLGAQHTAGLEMMTEMAQEFDPPETEAEAKRQLQQQLPDEVVEQARGPNGEFDPSRLDRAAQSGCSMGQSGRSMGLLGRVFALLRAVAIVFGGGIVVLVVVGVLLTSVLTV